MESTEHDANPDAYQYAGEELDQLSELFTQANTKARSPWDLLQALGTIVLNASEAETTNRSRLQQALEGGLAYDFVELDKNPYSVELGVQFSSVNLEWPPPFGRVESWVKQAWAEFSSVVERLIPKAQFLDLALSVGELKGPRVAQELVDLYLRIGDDTRFDSLYRVGALGRAWTLCRRFSLTNEAECRQSLLTILTEPGHPDGVIFRALRPLLCKPKNGDFVDPSRSDLWNILDALNATRRKVPLRIDAILQAGKILADTPDERKAVAETAIEAYLELASTTSGFAKVQWLETAAQLARDSGLPLLQDRAVALLQAVPLSELEFNENDIPAIAPRYMFDSRLALYRNALDIETALRIWFASGPPTGSHKANLEAAKHRAQSSAAALFGRKTFSSSGMPLKSSSGPDAAAEDFLKINEQIYSLRASQSLASELMAIRNRYDAKDCREIAASFATELSCDVGLVEELFRAVQSFWDERPSDAARAAYPLIEAGIRGLLLLLNEPLYRVENGTAEGRFPSLETYAKHLEGLDFDIDWLRTIRNPVSRLRNDLAHGHQREASDADAALLIRTAGLLVLLTPDNPAEEERKQVRSAFSSPVASVARKSGLKMRWRRVWTK